MSCLRFPYLFLLGLLSSFGHAPYHYWFLFVLGLVGFLKVNDYRFRCGFLFGLGYWIGTLKWIVFAFDVYDYRRLGVLSVFLLCGYLALYKGLSCFLAKKTPYPKISFCFLWVFFEYIQGHLFNFAFPWGYACFMWNSLEILQSVSVIGVYGLSLVTLLSIVSIFFAPKAVKILTVLLCSLVWFLGYQKLHKNPTELLPVNIRLVQPSISQKNKHNHALFRKNLDLHIALSNLPGERALSVIIWPETAFLSFMNQEIATFLSKKLKDAEKTYLITGALHKNGLLPLCFQKNCKENGIFNSIFVLLKDSVLHHYNKKTLVPFGECNPLPFIKTGFDSFEMGNEDKVIDLKNVPAFRPLICFEAIFPMPVTSEKWRLNLVNDAWYGDSGGPYQHLKIAQVRTIEAGIPLVRVCNNGISCVIDRSGRILYHLPLNQVGIIDFQLPK
jgi:apolipoprotein N-acyltransferase